MSCVILADVESECEEVKYIPAIWQQRPSIFHLIFCWYFKSTIFKHFLFCAVLLPKVNCLLTLLWKCCHGHPLSSLAAAHIPSPEHSWHAQNRVCPQAGRCCQIWNKNGHKWIELNTTQRNVVTGLMFLAFSCRLKKHLTDYENNRLLMTNTRFFFS